MPYHFLVFLIYFCFYLEKKKKYKMPYFCF